MDLHAALAQDSEVEELQPLPGLANAWMWVGPNDRFRSASVLAPDGEHAFELCAMDSWNEDLARAVLAFAVEHADELLGGDAFLTPVSGFKSTTEKFDTVSSISTDVFQYDHDDVPELAEATVAVFPAWHFEFSESATLDEAKVQIEDANGLNITVWDRKPLPFHRLRYINEKTQSRTRGTERKISTRDMYLRYLADLENTDENSFVEFENRLGEAWHVTWHDGLWHAAAIDDPTAPARTFDRAGIAAFAEESLQA